MDWKSAFIERTKANRLEYTILYIGGAVSVSILLSPFYFSYLPIDPQIFLKVSNSGIANTVAQILATIFAITISLSLLGVEYFSRELTPRIIPSLVRSRFIQGIVLSYTLSIPIVLFSKYSLQGPLQLALIFSLLVWALCCLLSYVVFIGMRLNPLGQAQFLRKQLPEDFDNSILKKMEKGAIGLDDSEDRIIDIQNIAIKSVNERNIFAFVQWLSLIFSIENEYISKRFVRFRAKPQFQEEPFKEMGVISSYFGFIHSLLLSEIRERDNSRFLRPYVDLLELRAERAIRMKNRHIFGKKIPPSNNGTDSAAEQFWDTFLFSIKCVEDTKSYRPILDNYLEIVLKSIIESENYLFRYGDIPSKEENTEFEYERIHWGRTIEDHYTSSLEKLHKYCSDMNLDDNSEVITLFDWSFGQLSGKILESEGGVELRKQLLSNLTYHHGMICIIGNEYDGYVFTSYLNMTTLRQRAEGEDGEISDENVELLIVILDRIEEYINAIDNVERYMGIFSPLVIETYIDTTEVRYRIIEIIVDYLEDHEDDDLNFSPVIEKALEDFESELTSDEVGKIMSVLDG